MISQTERDAAFDPNADRLREECGVFGIYGHADAAALTALGLHALQHRGQEAGGIVSYHPDHGFNSARRFGYVRDNFTKPDVMDTLPGQLAIGHVRYSTAGSKGATAIRYCLLYASFCPVSDMISTMTTSATPMSWPCPSRVSSRLTALRRRGSKGA